MGPFFPITSSYYAGWDPFFLEKASRDARPPSPRGFRAAPHNAAGARYGTQAPHRTMGTALSPCATGGYSSSANSSSSLSLLRAPVAVSSAGMSALTASLMLRLAAIGPLGLVTLW